MSTVMVTGQTGVSLYFYAIETSTNKPRDGINASVIAFNTATLKFNQTREREARVPTTPVALAAASSAWLANGFFHCGGGLYRCDFPDAAFAIGVKFVIVTVDGVMDTQFILMPTVENTGVDPRSATAPDVNATKFAGQTVNAAAAVTLPANVAAVGSAMALTTGERDSISNALLDLADAIEAGLTFRGALRLVASAAAGKASGMATATAVLRNAVADTKPRITATVDADGNRTAITTDVT